MNILWASVYQRIMTHEIKTALACVWTLSLTRVRLGVLAAGGKTGSLYLFLRALLLNNGFIFHKSVDMCTL